MRERAPGNNGKHLRALGQGGNREAHILQRLVLARGGKYIAKGDEYKFAERSTREWVFTTSKYGKQDDNRADGAVGEHKEDGVGEVFAVGAVTVRLSHDALLKYAIRKQRSNKASRARGERGKLALVCPPEDGAEHW